MSRQAGSNRKWIEVAGILVTCVALAACGSSSKKTDGGTVTADGGADGGARVDGGGSDGGADAGSRADGGSAGCGTAGAACTKTSDCCLSRKCNTNIRQCEDVTGGIGTSCPGGTECNASETACLPELPEIGRICSGPCANNDQCPSPYTCQDDIFVDADGGAIAVCLPQDARGKPCRNELANGDVDPVLDCTTQGSFCAPSSETSPTGNCVPGNDCNFANQTGCESLRGCESGCGCHPAGAFGFDNNRATLCQPSGSGTQGAACTRLSNCAKGYVCVPTSQTAAQCLKYCDPTVGASSCSGAGTGPDGGALNCIDLTVDDQGQPLPASVASIKFGVCFAF